MSDESEERFGSELLRKWLLERPSTAVIDVDNTLVRTNITEFYFYLMKRKGVQLRHSLQYYLLIARFALFWAPFYLILDYFNRDRFQQAFYHRYSGFTPDELELHAAAFFEEVLKPKLISPTSNIVNQLKHLGIDIVLLSTNFEPVVRQVAKHFGVPYYCLKVVKSRYGSQVDLSELTDFKLNKVSQYAADTTIAIADSKHDLHVLSYVKYPMVVSEKRRAWMGRIEQSYIRISPTSMLLDEEVFERLYEKKNRIVDNIQKKTLFFASFLFMAAFIVFIVVILYDYAAKTRE
jgi:phosphoserine phosphatase